MSAHAYVLRRIKWKGRRDEPTVVRVPGRMQCPDCGAPFSDHPDDPRFPWPGFVALCDGLVGKT